MEIFTTKYKPVFSTKFQLIIAIVMVALLIIGIHSYYKGYTNSIITILYPTLFIFSFIIGLLKKKKDFFNY
jgi:hypothetical protein